MNESINVEEKAHLTLSGHTVLHIVHSMVMGSTAIMSAVRLSRLKTKVYKHSFM